MSDTQQDSGPSDMRRILEEDYRRRDNMLRIAMILVVIWTFAAFLVDCGLFALNRAPFRVTGHRCRLPPESSWRAPKKALMQALREGYQQARDPRNGAGRGFDGARSYWG